MSAVSSEKARPKLRFVLVETTEPGNAGSVCRVLANFGYAPSDLVLANPHCDWRSAKAVARAGQAHGWLEQLRVVPNLSDAVADCARVVGTTAQIVEKLRRQFARPLREALPELLPLAEQKPVAILFGTEPTGLTHEQLLVCDELVTIPTTPAYPALNLAVSVGIVAYEASQFIPPSGPSTGQRLGDVPSLTVGAGELPPEEQPAEAKLVEIMFHELYRAAETIEFFNPENPLPLQFALRRILGKAHLTNQEARVLLGLARQILWKCREKP